MPDREHEGRLEEWREAMIERFSRWLDEVLEGEEPPQGIDAELLADLEEEHEEPFDLYSLWAAMTQMTQEVKLQGRAFGHLKDAVEGLGPKVRGALEVHEEGLRSLAHRLSEAQDPTGNDEILNTLLDIRDRLVTGLQTSQSNLEMVRGRLGSWRARLFGRSFVPLIDSVSALERGYRIGLERLDESLVAQGITPVGVVGEAFDPHTMQPIQVEGDTSSGALVTVVLRPGYVRDGRVLRYAQVSVKGSRGQLPAVQLEEKGR